MKEKQEAAGKCARRTIRWPIVAAGTNGLSLSNTAGGSTIRGLVINRFTGNGIDITGEDLRHMAPDPIVFAMANPVPEISYDEAIAARPDVILATGRRARCSATTSSFRCPRSNAIRGISCVTAYVLIAAIRRSCIGVNNAGDGTGCPK